MMSDARAEVNDPEASDPRAEGAVMAMLTVHPPPDVQHRDDTGRRFLGDPVVMASR